MWVEAESNKVGDLQIPKDLWRAMKAAGGVEVRLPTAERVRHLLTEYDHFVRNPDALKGLLDKLRSKLGGIVDGWFADIDAGRWERFVANVLTQHYDPAYRHSRERDFPHANVPVELADAGEEAIRVVVERLANEPRGEEPGVLGRRNTSPLAGEVGERSEPGGGLFDPPPTRQLLRS